MGARHRRQQGPAHHQPRGARRRAGGTRRARLQRQMADRDGRGDGLRRPARTVRGEPRGVPRRRADRFRRAAARRSSGRRSISAPAAPTRSTSGSTPARAAIIPAIGAACCPIPRFSSCTPSRPSSGRPGRSGSRNSSPTTSPRRSGARSPIARSAPGRRAHDRSRLGRAGPDARGKGVRLVQLRNSRHERRQPRQSRQRHPAAGLGARADPLRGRRRPGRVSAGAAPASRSPRLPHGRDRQGARRDLLCLAARSRASLGAVDGGLDDGYLRTPAGSAAERRRIAAQRRFLRAPGACRPSGCRIPIAAAPSMPPTSTCRPRSPARRSA